MSESRSWLWVSIQCFCSCHDPNEVQHGLSLILLLQRKSVLGFRALLFSCLQKILAEFLTVLPVPLHPFLIPARQHKQHRAGWWGMSGAPPMFVACCWYVSGKMLLPKDGGVCGLYSASRFSCVLLSKVPWKRQTYFLFVLFCFFLAP